MHKKHTISAMVYSLIKKGKDNNYIISAVKNRFPHSKINSNHMSWYRRQHRIKSGKIGPKKRRGGRPIDEEIQRKGNSILNVVRESIKQATKNDNEWFLLNRWIFARLSLDERLTKKKIKENLFKEKSSCSRCGEKFMTVKGVHLHRVNQKEGYHKGNCILLCLKCHNSVHRKA